jgi:hypothetical protein
MDNRILLAMAASLALAWNGPAAAGKVTLDAGLFAQYTANATGVQFTVCGHTADTSGCYGGGTMSPPFEQACAVLEGSPKQKSNKVSRDLYVLDKRTSKTDPVMLYVYTRTDTITDTSDSIQLSLKEQIPLPMTGGSKSHCYMVANDAFVYAGTDASATLGVVDKKTLAANPLSGGGLLSSLTADARGYIAMDFGGSFAIFDPNGGGVQSGGGVNYLVNTREGWKP